MTKINEKAIEQLKSCGVNMDFMQDVPKQKVEELLNARAKISENDKKDEVSDVAYQIQKWMFYNKGVKNIPKIDTCKEIASFILSHQLIVEFIFSKWHTPNYFPFESEENMHAARRKYYDEQKMEIIKDSSASYVKLRKWCTIYVFTSIIIFLTLIFLIIKAL